jgi:excisionase family DNA binding protein
LHAQLLDVKETAAALGLGRSKIYQLIMTGELKSIVIGRSRRVPVSAIEEFIRTKLGEQWRPEHGSWFQKADPE